MIDTGLISVNVSGARTGEEAEWAFDAANSWLRRDEPSVGERYEHSECGWIVVLKRTHPRSVKASFRYAQLKNCIAD